MRPSVEEENRMVLDWAFMDDADFLLKYVIHGTQDDLIDFGRRNPGFLGFGKRTEIKEALLQKEKEE